MDKSSIFLTGYSRNEEKSMKYTLFLYSMEFIHHIEHTFSAQNWNVS